MLPDRNLLWRDASTARIERGLLLLVLADKADVHDKLTHRIAAMIDCPKKLPAINRWTATQSFVLLM